MKPQRIDPRDTCWEIEDPAYRVYFWSQGGAQGAIRASEEWQLTDASDVRAVLSWAAENSNHRQFVVYVSARTDDGLGLIRLLGADPSAP